MPLPQKKRLREIYHTWNLAKRRKYDPMINLKYGPVFLKKLQRSAGGLSSGTTSNEASPATVQPSSSSSDQIPKPIVSDTEILTPTIKLPEEIFATDSGFPNFEDQQIREEESHSLGRSRSNRSLKEEGKRGIPEMDPESSEVNSDIESGRRSKELFETQFLKNITTNRRKRRAPQKILKDGNVPMKEGYIKLVDCNAEKLSELSLLDESQAGGIETTQEDGEATYLSVQQADNPREVRCGTVMEGGSTDGSLIFYSTSDDEMPSMVPARRTNISIPKRKTARKKVNGKPTKLLSLLQRGERKEKDGDSKSSSEENWSDLKELVLTNQSPSLKVVCNQLKSPELDGDGPASAGQKDRREDTSEKDERRRMTDGNQLMGREGSEGKFGEINSTDVGKNKEDGINQKSSKDPNEIQTGDGLQHMAKASVAKSLVFVEKKRKFGEVGFTEGEVSLTTDEPQMTSEDKQEKKSREVLWEGTLRQAPKKLKPYQVTPPSARSKKKKPSEKSMPLAKPNESTMTPASRVIKPYRNVATPSPLAMTPNGNQQPSTSKPAQKLTVKPKFALGQLVWGHMKGFPWWPGKVVHHHAMKRREPPAEGLVIIQWFGDMKFSQLKDIQVKGFENYAECVNVMFLQKRNLYKKAMFQAFTLAAAQMQKTFNDEVKEYPSKDASDEEKRNFEETFHEMKSWADGGFAPLGPKGLLPLPEDAVEPPPPPPSLIDTPKVNTAKKESEWEDTRDERMVELRKKEIALEEFCLACGSKSILTEEHPLFVGGLCEVCRIEYLETAYMFADDGYQCYCCICAEGKELVLCENKGCYRSFCLTCVKLLIDQNEPNKVMSQDPWICYMCQPGETFGYLNIRDDWPSRLHKLFSRDQDLEFGPLRSWSPKPLSERKPIRVLSLFDGIGTGMFVLRELGFVVDVYVASEINSDAIKVSSVRQKGTITHVGDIRGITAKQLRELGPFDLLIGGSPCNDLSIVNPARKGIYGGTGLLFFEFSRILRLLELTATPDQPLFWFFENVVFMGHQDKMTINRFLECNPVLVDAKDLSPAHRARYFWGNLPGMNRPSAALVDSPLKLQDCLEQHCNREAKFSKIRTITTKANSIRQQKEAVLPVHMDGKEDGLWCTELERLFGFPDHYTDVCNLSSTGRQKLLGQCWSVPVIHHLLAPLKDYFQCE